MLAAPDFVGYESVIAMAGNPDLLPIVKKALQAKRLGNDISVVVTGHEIQNRTAVVGGFTAVPTRAQLQGLKERLQAAKEFCVETVQLAARLASQAPFPELVRPCEHVALKAEDSYAIYEGRLVSTEGLDVPDYEYPQWLIEKHVPPSNAKHAIVKGRDSFLTGPLARVNLNFSQLSPDAQAAAREVGFQAPDFNPFMSIVARGIEMLHVCDAASEVIDQLGTPVYEEPRYQVKAGEGYAVTEAPRGIFTHGGRFDKDGICLKWDIVAPTARNIYNLEKDFREFIPRLLHLPDEELTLKIEMMVRNYDPCQSCATHALRVNLVREG
jgi:coenzyme F420-reducing hydrogenase alpha subunit